MLLCCVLRYVLVCVALVLSVVNGCALVFRGVLFVLFCLCCVVGMLYYGLR